ncbi:WD40 repeat domain-containing protein [Zavarzinella formosa]|uniref:WD40 repeat domain-containing protein n=1 Tax=Zavarzinella formosa TaxID=360055 RepID=UPI0002E38372|nr:WD40 repeat domain-containing protein [Zavarzinella formosa]
MNTWTFRVIIMSVACCLPSGRSIAAEAKESALLKGDEAREIAVLKGPDGDLGWMIFSANGSRMLAGGLGAVVWDVANQRQVCVLKGIEQRRFANYGGKRYFSADGQTAAIVDARAGSVWDANTGEVSFSVPPLGVGSRYTAASLSPDGAYLALASDEWTGKSKGTVRSYLGGVITLWDLKTRKIKWQTEGIPEEAEAVASSETGKGLPGILKGRVNSLEFSPDSNRFAAYGQGLNIYSPDAGKVPLKPPGDVVIEELMQWRPDGKTFLIHQSNGIAVYNPQTGKSTVVFSPKYPARPAPKPAGNKLPSPYDADSLPPDWHADMDVFSRDGSRYLSFVWFDDNAARVRRNRVFVWDIADKSLVGLFQLPDEPYDLGKPAPKPAGKNAPIRKPNLERIVPVSVSADGKKVAIGGAGGVTRIYDVSAVKTVNPVVVKPAPAADRLTIGSVWKGEKHRNETNKTMPAILKITERDGTHFKGELTTDGANVSAVAGTVADGKIKWDTTKVLKGNSNQPMSGTLDGDSIHAKFDITVRANGKTYTATGIIKLTKSN